MQILSIKIICLPSNHWSITEIAIIKYLVTLSKIINVSTAERPMKKCVDSWPMVPMGRASDSIHSPSPFSFLPFTPFARVWVGKEIGFRP